MATTLNLNLKYIVSASFQCSEKTNYERLCEKKQVTLGDSDVVVFVSSSANQIIFLNRPRKGSQKGLVYDSRRLRLTKGGWDPLFIKEYAKQVGINLVGLDKLQKLFDRKLRKTGQVVA
jgi:hypothetical protein